MTLQKLLNGETDDRGHSINFETNGNVFRPWFNTVNTLVNEARLHADANGLHVHAVDPTNVGYVDTHLYADALETYDYDLGDDGEYVTGVPVDSLASAASVARKGATTADPLTISFDGDRQATVETEREYGSTTVERGSSVSLIDPGMVRDRPNAIDIGTTIRGEIDTLPFRDVLSELEEHATLAADGDDLLISEELDETASAARFRDVLSETPGESEGTIYSVDYLADMASAVRASKADAVSFAYAPEYPIRLRFERIDDDGTTLYDGSYLLAPRISTD